MRLCEIPTQGYRTLLLDRDGTINVHLVGGYVTKWSEFEFIPGTLEALACFARSFDRIFIVTNQRGVGKGLMSEADLADIHMRMKDSISQSGGRIDGIYCCTALSDGDLRRKPGRGMFDEILSDFPDVDPKTTLMIGDSDSDELFAHNCGIAFRRVDSLKRDSTGKYWTTD